MKTKLAILVFTAAIVRMAEAAPNIVVIVADDLGYGDVSYNGCPDYATPNIDALAASGAKCGSGYVSACFCSPSRAGLLTGRHQDRFGHENQPTPDVSTNPRLGIPLNEVLLPQVLKSAGYATGIVGKWHVGSNLPCTPLRRGFDEFFGFLGSKSVYYNAPILRGTQKIIEAEYLTDAFTREALSFIDRHAANGPFFLYLAYNAPHIPLTKPPSEYVARVSNITNTNRRNYAATVVALDDGIGKVLADLQSNGIDSNTLVFFLSDNGAPSATYTRNLPLRGYKYNVLEGGIRVPFAVRWPGQIPPQSYDQPVSSLDIMATVAAVTGATLPTDRPYDGVNLLPYFGGQQTPAPRALYWRWPGLGVATGPPGALDTIYAVRQGNLKYVRERSSNAQKLYDVSADISEKTNLAASQPTNFAALQSAYVEWNKLLIAPLWAPVPTSAIVSLTMAGDWGPEAKFTRVIAPGLNGTPDGYNWLTYAMQGVAGVHSYSLKKASKKWGGGAVTNVDGATDLPVGGSATITMQAGSYYSFRCLDTKKPSVDAVRVGVFRTTNAPVNVALAAPSGHTINVTLSAPKSSEERVYVRWSSDTFVTSHMIEAAGVGTQYSATIPTQAVPVQYTAVTSTADLSQLVYAGEIDGRTLACSASAKLEP
jgi:arylsulfatase A-like enzyme